MLSVPVPSGPEIGLKFVSFVLLAAMVRFVAPARFTPPVKVFAPESCKLPPPEALIALLALVSTEVMISVGWSGAMFWPLKVIGLTVMDGEATSFRLTVPAFSVALVEGLLEEAVIEPLLSVRMPVGVTV